MIYMYTGSKKDICNTALPLVETPDLGILAQGKRSRSDSYGMNVYTDAAIAKVNTRPDATPTSNSMPAPYMYFQCLL